MLNDDTIAAIATPEGSGGVGIIRISGAKAKARIKELFRPLATSFTDFRPWTLHRGYFYSEHGELLDDVLTVFMPAPNTFTGEDVIELHCHGGYVLLNSILESLLTEGIRLANRGEFSYRAFLNGRIDLTQAEAIAELISASSKEEVKLASTRLKGLVGVHIKQLHESVVKIRTMLCLAIDFSEEEVVEASTIENIVDELESMRSIIKKLLSSFERSQCWSKGLIVALIGLVNAGKSSLFNALLGRERAIVTNHPGTTRDFLEETIYVSGFPIRIVDTAGHRLTCDPVEAQGIEIGKERAYNADVVLLVIDSTQGIKEEVQSLIENIGSKPCVYVWNKVDLNSDIEKNKPVQYDVESNTHNVYISAKTGYGVDELTSFIREYAHTLNQGHEPKVGDIAPNIRQAKILSEVLEEVDALIFDVTSHIPYDLCSVRLESIAMNLSSIIGTDTSEDILNRIFASFCIGK